MNISYRIANANTQCGRITNPPEREKKLQTTIRRIREDAEKKRHGEEHSRGIKR